MAGLFSSFAGALVAADSPRFTDGLTVAQKTEVGLDHLNSDNVAVINALVRQDEAAAHHRDPTVVSTSFSTRRNDHEREITGIDHLTPAQVKRLDELIAPRITDAVPPPPDAVFVPSLPSLIISSVDTVSPPRSPLEIHGSFSLSYGWSKEGSTRGGDAVVSIHDPDHNLTVTLGYSEYRGKIYTPLLSPIDNYYYNRPGFDPLSDR
jgi:hypothetical protein